MTSNKFRAAAIALWFLSGMLMTRHHLHHGKLVLGLLAMTSAVLFGLAMFIDYDDKRTERKQAHMDGFFSAKRRVQELLDGRIGVLQSKAENERREGNYKEQQKLLREAGHVNNVRSAVRNYVLYNTQEYK